MLLGLILAIVSTVCNGFGAVTSRKLKGTSPSVINIWQGFFVSLILGIYMAFRQDGFRFNEYAAYYGFAEAGALCYVVCLFSYIIAF